MNLSNLWINSFLVSVYKTQLGLFDDISDIDNIDDSKVFEIKHAQSKNSSSEMQNSSILNSLRSRDRTKAIKIGSVIQDSIIINSSKHRNNTQLIDKLLEGKQTILLQTVRYIEAKDEIKKRGITPGVFKLTPSDLILYKKKYMEGVDNRFFLFFANSMSTISKLVTNNSNSFSKLVIRLKLTDGNRQLYTNLLKIKHDANTHRFHSIVARKYDRDVLNELNPFKKKVEPFKDNELLKLLQCDQFREQAQKEVISFVYKVHIKNELIQKLLIDLSPLFKDVNLKTISRSEYEKMSYIQKKRELERWVKSQIPMYKLYLIVNKYKLNLNASENKNSRKKRRATIKNFRTFLIKSGYKVYKNNKDSKDGYTSEYHTANKMLRYTSSEFETDISNVVSSFQNSHDLWISNLSQRSFIKVFK